MPWQDISSKDPLLLQLRRGGLLWHCTSVGAFREILGDTAITPNEGRISKWGPKPSACQALGGISLFDFTNPTESQVLETALHWRPFLAGAPPVTVVVGLE